MQSAWVDYGSAARENASPAQVLWQGESPKALTSGGKAAIALGQRVEDNAFHLKTGELARCLASSQVTVCVSLTF
jgi:hypothetical protein